MFRLEVCSATLTVGMRFRGGLPVIGISLKGQVVRDGLDWIALTFYSSSISLSAACSGERHAVVGSGGLNTASRSMAMR